MSKVIPGLLRLDLIEYLIGFFDKVSGKILMVPHEGSKEAHSVVQ